MARDDYPKPNLPDLNPIPGSLQSYTWLDMSSLWFSMILNLPSYYIAAGLVALGMSWYQALLTIISANTILLFPLLLTSHPGPLYGISFPLVLRPSFGISGASVPSLLRALVACGWSSIQSWFGAQALLLLIPSSFKSSFHPIPYLGTSLLEFLAFLLFLVLQLIILFRGMTPVRFLSKFAAPVLLGLTGWLFIWAYRKAGGFGSMLSTPSRFDWSQFWPVFFPSLTANIGVWSTVALNICDFTRFVQSQKDQILGQVGLPVFIGVWSFLSLAITSSTEVIYGRVISNPIELLSEMDPPIIIKIIGFLGIILAVLTTNIPANYVASANTFVSLSPSKFDFARGAVATAIISIFFQPWRLLSSSQSFLYTWLVGYSAIVGPIASIILADYYILRRTILDVNGLYSTDPSGPYYYNRGFNVRAFVALGLSIAPLVPGFLGQLGVVQEVGEVFVVIYGNAYFFGFFTAGVVYLALSCGKRTGGTRSMADGLLDPLWPRSDQLA
ncbi:Purine-uracil permease NCS1 [Carex littledalei]|uniref:Purine-uracil permease NCS1 n=1 Tax=Carex littledalei TaxID=544730 RepID=A0A833QNK4_9POAL|nr:Purine-uracil permease NCS1 [Carex littledalei]